MPLHTAKSAEAPFTSDLGSGDHQSMLGPNDRADYVVVQTFTWVDSYEKAKMAGGELCPEHDKLISRWNGRCSGVMKAAAKQHAETAFIVRLNFIYLHTYLHIIHSF